MISYIKLKNFRCHESLLLELHPGVNVIVGRSGAGKSAGIVGPLRNLVFNRPTGDGYRRWETEETSIEVGLGEGGYVRKFRSNKDHYYDVDGTVLRAFGQNPPDQVKKALNMGELNFNLQHDPLYLLSMSGPELGRLLNDLAGLDLIDTSLKKINSRLSSEKEEASRQKALQEGYKEDLKRYSDLPALESTLEEAEGFESLLASLKEKSSRLSKLVRQLEQVEETLKGFHGLEELQEGVKQGIRYMEESRSNKARSSSIRSITQGMTVCEATLIYLKSVDSMKSSITKVQNSIQEPDRIRGRAKGIKELVAAIDWSEEKIAEIDNELRIVHKEWEKVRPRDCPLCGREWSERFRKEIH